MELKNKVIVITGASSGIGRELAFQFAAKGAILVLAARRHSLLEETVQDIKSKGQQALAVPTDVSIRSYVEYLAKRAFDTYGRLDVFIANAGVSLPKGPLTENAEPDVQATMDINFMGGVYGVWAAVPYMVESGGGLLVFVSSIVGRRGIPTSAVYCASKFAVQGLTESIRPELKSKNIRVLNVCPPGVDTPFFENNGKHSVRRYRLHPVGKIARSIVKACEKEKRELLPTLDAKLLYWLNVFFPRVIDWAVARVKGVK